MKDGTAIATPVAAMAVELQRWIEASLGSGRHVLAESNQGTLLLFEGDGLRLVIKTASGRGALRRARQATLEREHEAYRRLQGVTGVPACYGLLAGKHLLLQYIEGTPYRQAAWRDRDAWFESLFEIIGAIHGRGVGHGDLKSKSNLIVGRDETPWVVDFGTAIIARDGFHPLNHYLYGYARRLDINAWVKHKYHGRYRDASAADRKRLDYSKLEYVIRRLRGRPMH